MKYDSVLDQQSISGKIVSLILCVWKPCYVKSGHICCFTEMGLLLGIRFCNFTRFSTRIFIVTIHLAVLKRYKLLKATMRSI